MTDIKSLLAAATPLPIHHTTLHEFIEHHPANAPLAAMLLNAAPLVLEYMKGGHHDGCSWVYSDDDVCNCGYSALTRALGVEE